MPDSHSLRSAYAALPYLDNIAPTIQYPSAAPVAGSLYLPARRDHKHGEPYSSVLSAWISNNQTRTSTTAYSTITGCTITAASADISGNTFIFNFILYVQNQTGGGGMKMQWLATGANITSMAGDYYVIGGTSIVKALTNLGSVSTTTATLFNLAAPAANWDILCVFGYINVGIGTTQLALQLAQNTSSAVVTSVNLGSFLQVGNTGYGSGWS